MGSNVVRICVVLLLQIAKQSTAQEVSCAVAAGYETREHIKVFNDECINDCGGPGYSFSTCRNTCNGRADCVAFSWFSLIPTCYYILNVNAVAPCTMGADVRMCSYIKISEREAYCTIEGPTPAPTAPRDISHEFGLVASCLLEDRTVTIQITERDPPPDLAEDETEGSLSNCVDFWNALENGILDDQESTLEPGVCNITDDAQLTISQYELSDISHCVEPSDENIKVVSSMLDIDLKDSEEVADVFIFGIKYNLGPVSSCENEIDESPTLTCEWFDVQKQEFSSSGCELLEIKQKGREVFATCQCEHLTAFAILHDTISFKDNCHASNVFRNYIWIIYIILYTFVMVIALFQIRYILGVKKSLKDLLSVKFGLHCVIVFICLLNISIAATFLQIDPAAPGPSPISMLFVAWSSLYVLSFWVYSLVVYTWADLYHMDLGNTVGKYVKYVFLAISAVVTILILFVFITTASSDKGDMEKNVQIGSTMIAVICFITALAYLGYGGLVVRRLTEINSAVDKSNDPVKPVIKRITKVVFVCFIMFIGQALIVLISVANKEVFFSNFTVFQAFYLIFDICILVMAMVLFYDVIQRQYFKKEINATTESDGKSSGLRNV